MSFVRARLSRRLFMLFMLSAFLPLAALAILSVSQVRGLLIQQGEARLASMAKTYGMTLFERLLLASDVGIAAASATGPAPADDALARRTFAWIAAVRNGGVRTVMGHPSVPALTPAVLAHVAYGKPAVFVPDESHPRILVAAPLDPEGRSMMVGELLPQYIWGPEDELPAATAFCVIEDTALRILYCSSPMPQAAFGAAEAASHSSFGAATWRWEGELYTSRAWSQFLRAAFGTPDWIVLATQPQSHQLSRAAEFTSIYIPVALVAVLLATWFTLRQSRNILQPVEKLAERARAIARNDFAGRLALRRDDEFGELGTAFDQMSDKLGRQIASLTALSEIDRLILSTQDVAQIVRAVLHRVVEFVAADQVSVTLFDPENPEHARTYFRPPQANDSMSMSRHEAAGAERLELEGDFRPRTVAISAARLPCYLEPMRDAGLGMAYLQPIVSRGEPCGVLVLGYRGEAEPSDEDRQQARELADRLAVAVSSAWREEQLYVQAHFDALTALPNRLLFEDRLEREIARSEREGVRFALLFVDLDHFKHVNDSFGHGAGDVILREAARRIARCVRETDTVSRLGGDEFTVLVTGLGNPQEAFLIGEAMIAALSGEFTVGEQRCFLSASIGIASYPGDGASAAVLLKSADTAMYRAKAAGRSQVIFFEERMNAEAVARLTLDRDLRAAIERGELILHYQPQLDLRTGRIRGAEALVRWNHPVHGSIAPLRFIPLAEESGFIDPLGRWVVQQACRQFREWRDAGIALERIAVNVSPRQFRKRTLVDHFAQCVAREGIDPSHLEIEVTEGLLMERSEAVEQMLGQLAAAGHPIALDDFGTGFSSMSYLKRFPVNTIKIDRVFVQDIGERGEAEAIVAAIIAMSHALGKSVIAEGVETAAQSAVLQRLQCDEIQGFLVGRALPPEEFETFYRGRLEVATLG